MNIQYPVLIEPGNAKTAWGVIFPDLPGCFSASDHEQDILQNAREAALLYLESLNAIPSPSDIADHIDRAQREGFVVSLVEVDLSKIEGPSKRININVPASLLARIDIAAKAQGKSRSAFMTEAAVNYANRRT
jgi:predicted RNase H-like HicB family nuclease